MNKFFAGFGVVVLGGLIFLCVSIVFAFPIKWCWNYVMPYLFNLQEINVIQAWVLNVLCGFLFKSVNYKNG